MGTINSNVMNMSIERENVLRTIRKMYEEMEHDVNEYEFSRKYLSLGFDLLSTLYMEMPIRYAKECLEEVWMKKGHDQKYMY